MTPIAAAIACLLVVTLCYAAMCAGSPFGRCRKCNGWGFQMKTDRKGQLKRGKDCRRCKATGRRIRIGRWLFNRAQRIYREGTR
ncbi:hypothetical protein ACH492_08885 [Streptomyces sp. NPDC019443]|uniref:hypothetical protein n=1 Tax=unclassified Streptomyces TaxID=2593676 RepID=UPI002257A926|nr:hypothetical protein [Streptomyces sp. NBC_01481]MCX4587055.1 hypothetical protein [Streptomyces sp. NBC_01481]